MTENKADPMREALALARKRIEYLGSCGLNHERHQNTNETDFFPIIDAALAAPQPAAPLGGREAAAREECLRRGIDPDDICADGGVTAWMVVDQETREGGRHPIEILWREHDLPEWFLGNGGTNTKLYALYDAILAIPQERGVDRAAVSAELLDRIRAKAQSRVEYWKQISPHNFDGGHMDMLIGQFQTIANDIAAVAAELPLVATTDRAAIIEECLEAAHIGFEESMSQYALIGPGGMAMAIINAIRALGKETGR